VLHDAREFLQAFAKDIDGSKGISVATAVGRFYDRKMPYLSDRSQEFELESLRPLHHHNTLLSILTETGMIGFAAFALLDWLHLRSPGCSLPPERKSKWSG